MYHHTVSDLSNVKSTFSYGYGFSSHVEAYWITSGAIKVGRTDYPCDNMIYCATMDDYDLDCKVGYGRSEAEAIEDLLCAMDDGRR